MILPLVPDHPLDALDNLFIITRPGLVQDAHPYQADSGGNPVPLPILPDLRIGNDAGYVSAMPVRVYGVSRIIDEIYPGKDAVFLFSIDVAGDTPVRAQAGVYHGDGHALSDDAALPGDICADYVRIICRRRVLPISAFFTIVGDVGKDGTRAMSAQTSEEQG